MQVVPLQMTQAEIFILREHLVQLQILIPELEFLILSVWNIQMRLLPNMTGPEI